MVISREKYAQQIRVVQQNFATMANIVPTMDQRLMSDALLFHYIL